MKTFTERGGLLVLYFLIAITMCVALALFWIAPAKAQVVASDAARVRWANATELTTGEPIPAPPDPLSLKTTTIQRAQVAATATCSASSFATPAQVLNVTADVLTVLFEGLRPAGRHCFRARHVQENGTASNWSAIASKVITIPAPAKSGPPTITVE